MASTLTQRNAAIIAARPGAGRGRLHRQAHQRQAGASEDFRRELIEKTVALGRARTRAAPARTVVPLRPQSLPLRTSRAHRPRIIAIGSSTGGPQALADPAGQSAGFGAMPDRDRPAHARHLHHRAGAAYRPRQRPALRRSRRRHGAARRPHPAGARRLSSCRSRARPIAWSRASPRPRRRISAARRSIPCSAAWPSFSAPMPAPWC